MVQYQQLIAVMQTSLRTLSPEKLTAGASDMLRRLLRSPVKTFIVTALLFGSLFIVFALPFTGADEEAHFVRAYGISHGNFRLIHTNNVEMPKSYRYTLGCFQSKQPVPGTVYQYNYDNYGVNKGTAFRCASNLPLDSKDVEAVSTSAPGYSPTTYIPQVAAIIAGRVLNLPIVHIDYLVRFAVLAAYVAMVAFAISLLPSRKWALVGVALLPTSLLQITNPGGDYMLYGAVAILVATVVRSISISRKQLETEHTKLMLLLAITASLLVLPKGIFPGICFLPLMLFYGGIRRDLAKKSAVIIAALVIGLSWQKFGVSAVLAGGNTPPGSILDFPYAFLKTMFFRWSNGEMVYRGDSLQPFSLSTSTLGMPSFAVTLMNVLLALYIFVGYPEPLKLRVSTYQMRLIKYVAILIAIAVIVGSFAAMFVVASYLQPGDHTIKGVQTRYFYPVFFMLAMLPFARSFHVKSKTTFIASAVVGSAALLMTQLIVILIQYRWA